jgi:hypothetical protein
VFYRTALVSVQGSYIASAAGILFIRYETTCSTARVCKLQRASSLNHALCGVATTFAWFTIAWRSGVIAVSDSRTSRPAPAILLESIAASRAASSIHPPRAVLMMNAVFFIFLNAASLKTCLVLSLRGA